MRHGRGLADFECGASSLAVLHGVDLAASKRKRSHRAALRPTNDDGIKAGDRRVSFRGAPLFSVAYLADFDESEQLFLFTVAQQMDLSPDEFEDSLPDGEIVLNDVRLDAPEDEELRVAWLRNLILMVAADGVLTPSEYQTCMFFSEQLGFAPAVVDDVLMSLKR